MFSVDTTGVQWFGDVQVIQKCFCGGANCVAGIQKFILNQCILDFLTDITDKSLYSSSSLGVYRCCWGRPCNFGRIFVFCTKETNFITVSRIFDSIFTSLLFTYWRVCNVSPRLCQPTDTSRSKPPVVSHRIFTFPFLFFCFPNS